MMNRKLDSMRLVGKCHLFTKTACRKFLLCKPIYDNYSLFFLRRQMEVKSLAAPFYSTTPQRSTNNSLNGANFGELR
jgi:hypothetical protein